MDIALLSSMAQYEQQMQRLGPIYTQLLATRKELRTTQKLKQRALSLQRLQVKSAEALIATAQRQGLQEGLHDSLLEEAVEQLSENLSSACGLTEVLEDMGRASQALKRSRLLLGADLVGAVQESCREAVGHEEAMRGMVRRAGRV